MEANFSQHKKNIMLAQIIIMTCYDKITKYKVEIKIKSNKSI